MPAGGGTLPAASRGTRSPVRHLKPSDYARMPWKNGGGTTTEIAVDPPEGGVAAGFRWRVSIAEVAADGPFSAFPGYDRLIVMVAGAGMTLDAGANGRHALARRDEPFAFPGEWAVEGRLAGGPVRDFNVMTRRADTSARLAVRGAPLALPADGRAGTVLVHVLAGPVAYATGAAGQGRLETGDTLIAAAGELAGAALTPLAAERPCRLAVVEIAP